MKSIPDGEDLVQETCLAASRNYTSLRDPEAFQPWLMGIARNKYADYCRKKKKNPETPTDILPDETEYADSYPDEDGTLLRLREKDRIMLTLFYLERVPQRQIAQALSIPEGTVKSRLHAARERFRRAYPQQEKKGASTMNNKLPAELPPYRITQKNAAPFPVKWEEMMGWFIVPKIGEGLRWGMYDLPSRQLDVAYDMRVTGPARVHNLEGVEITARLLTAREVGEDDPMGEPIGSSGAREGDWRFVAQIKDDHTRFLAAERQTREGKILSTFLDPDFMDNWGFGENNQGNPVYLAPRGLIRREGSAVACQDGKGLIDVVGRYEIDLDGEKHDTVCVMDVNAYMEDVVSEQYLDENGRTVLWRRFNPNEWRREKYGRTWAEMLPENEQITVNGRLYVHWYDCLCAG